MTDRPVHASQADDRDLPLRPWSVREPGPGEHERASEIAAALGLDEITARVLVGRGVNAAAAVEEFFDPPLDGLHSPFKFVQMEAAVERVGAAIDRGERIVIHGDYDVDGITSTVLLVRVLRGLGADVEYLIPHRLEDGYGLQVEGIERARALGAGLVVAVDCGISAHAAAERAREVGIDLVVVDHHVALGDMPPAVAILNPRLDDSGYPEAELAAVGVAFKLTRGLLERRKPEWTGLAMLKLVALGTVADLVPLTGENRVMARHGLATLGEAVNPGLKSLLRTAGVGGGRVAAEDIAFRIAPRINAAGRLDDPGIAAELFLTDDPARAQALARKLHSLNTKRQTVERAVAAEAATMAPLPDDAITIAVGDGWHRGVIGIAASRLVRRWGRPAVVVTTEGDRAFGSARSVPGIDLVALLGGVGDVFDDYGGHRQAAGFSLPAARVPEMVEGLTAVANKAAAAFEPPPLVCDAALETSSATLALAGELERLAPFGKGNPRPRFLWRDLQLAVPPKLLGEDHLRLTVHGDRERIDAVGWGFGQFTDRLSQCSRIDAVATLQTRTWAGRRTVQLQLDDLLPHDEVARTGS